MTVKVSDVFQVKYGVNLELNKMVQTAGGINFVSRTENNNGVSAQVAPLDDVEPIAAGTISVAGGGSVMASFLQASPYYSGRDLYYLTAKVELTVNQKLYYCSCLRANRYRFNYGRQANRTLKDLLIPAPDDLPKWIEDSNPEQFMQKDTVLEDSNKFELVIDTWEWFSLGDLFNIKKGKRLTKAKMSPGNTPFIGAIELNNGYRQSISAAPIHEGGTITVNYNGSVAEAFYQPQPFWASDDVNVLYPRFTMSKFVALFICTVIRREKYRFNYGRKWHMERMENSRIKLPITQDGELDLNYMENMIKALPFSTSV